ncbi:MAG: beta-N-acetylhexosaminidase [Clostridia bacterium]|nr:beta-N-acetylhexosaminidase [Clostridia bacterium]
MVESLLNSMTLEEKIGQMVMVGFDGQSLTPELENHLSQNSVGNVIFFSRNIVDNAQVWAFTRDLQQVAARRRVPIGFITAIDQEGGVVARLLDGVSVFPGNMALGAIGSPNYARRAAEVMAQEMLGLGLNMNLAPVLDVNNNPDNPGIGARSYGEDAELVAKLGTAAIEGSQSVGVIATAKHFPGKGDVTIDSHIDLPHVPHGRERLNSVELVPFKAAIAAGVGAIMTAHVTFPSIEPEPLLPATMSRNVLTGLLRNELHFDGITITDDLFMGAISREYGLAEAAIRAIVAGADIALMCHKPDEQAFAIRAAVEAARSGRIPRERIDSSVRRVLAAKARFGILEPRVSDVGRSGVGSPANRALALEIARRAVTVVQNNYGIIPYDAERGRNVLVVTPDVKNLTMVEDTGSHGSGLAKAVRAVIPEASDICVSQSPSAEEIGKVAAGAAGRDLVIVGTYNSHLYPQQAALVRRLAEVGVPVVVVGMRNPYDVKDFADVGTYIAAYGFRDCSMQAAIEVVFGSLTPSGVLPVTVPGLH